MNEDSKKALKMVKDINRFIPLETIKLSDIKSTILKLQQLSNKIVTIESQNPPKGDSYFTHDDLLELIDLVNLLGLISTAYLDLIISIKNVFLTDNSYERGFHVKQAIHTVYEVHNKLQNIEILSKFANKLNSELLKDHFKSLINKQREFRSKGRIQLLGRIRNQVSGHYNPNFIEMNQVLNDLYPNNQLWSDLDKYLKIILSIKSNIALIIDESLKAEKPFSEETQEVWSEFLTKIKV